MDTNTDHFNPLALHMRGNNSFCSCSLLNFGVLYLSPLSKNPVINTVFYVLYLYVWHDSHLTVKRILDELLVSEQLTSYLELG